jgi:hypothetical protein
LRSALLDNFKDESVMEYKKLKQKQVSKEMEAKIASNISHKLLGIDNILKKASLAGAFVAEAIQDQT